MQRLLMKYFTFFFFKQYAFKVQCGVYTIAYLSLVCPCCMTQEPWVARVMIPQNDSLATWFPGVAEV